MNSPNYKFEFGDVQLFQKQLEDTILEQDLDTELNFRTETNAFGDLLLSIIPFVLIIGIWIFIMRRMSGGGGPEADKFSILNPKQNYLMKNLKQKLHLKM